MNIGSPKVLNCGFVVLFFIVLRRFSYFSYNVFTSCVSTGASCKRALVLCSISVT